MNYMKTTLLLGGLTCLMVLLGQFIGGSRGAVGFFIMAALMNFLSYWFSDKIVLMMYRAKQADETKAPRLHAIVRELAGRANIPMPKVYIVEDPSPNAFATGRNPSHASVAATTGILNLLSEEELRGVMAHELAHVQNRDILISSIAATFAGAISMIANVIQWGAMFGGASRDDEDRGGNMIASIAMAIIAPIAAMVIQMAISRSREYAADYAGAKLSGKPLSLASALGRLEQSVRSLPMQTGSPSTAHMCIVNPFRGGIAGLFSTHPPMEERIKRLQQIAREM
jgi:heat shock protein HtpX